MFANIDDSTQTMESIISYIMSGQGKFNQVSDWQEFLEAVRKVFYRNFWKRQRNPCGELEKNSIASLIRALLIIRFSQRDIREDEGETRIGDALKYIKKNEVHVIDIAKLSEDKQAYVFLSSAAKIQYKVNIIL